MTTNRLQFRVAALREQIEQTLADHIDAAQAERAQTPPLSESLPAWRTEQIKRVRSLASRFSRGDVTDDELENFSTRNAPTARAVDRAESKFIEAVRVAYERRDQAVRRLEAMRAYTPEGEAEPVLELSPSMARDWFGI